VKYQEHMMTNQDPVTQGKAARIVQFFSLMMFYLGIDHEITYWFWKILVFPGRPLFPGDAVSVECLVDLPRTGPMPGERLVYVLKHD
jgi:hypothetical protein